jgi:hypothetical protein
MFDKLKLVLCVIICSMVSVCFADSVELTTETGILGADSTIRGAIYGDDNYGGWHDLLVKGTSPEWARKSYVRFDVNNLITGYVTNATLELVLTSTSTASTIVVYGLKNGDSGELWNEVDPSGLTWNNAPANDVASGVLLNNNAYKLGEISVDGTLAVGDVLSFSTNSLSQFLNDDTNGVVTLMLVDLDNVYFAFASKENPTYVAPTLKMEIDIEGQYISTIADASINGGSYADTNFGDATFLMTKGSGDPQYNRKSYVQFDVPVLPGWHVDESKLILEIYSAEISSAVTLEVWGLKDSISGNDWSESTLTWNNAPATVAASVDLDSSKVVSLGQILIDTPAVGSVISLESDALSRFLEDDSDGEVTVIITNTEDNQLYLYSRQMAESKTAPTLRLVVTDQFKTV